ncbi:hypothetical protein BH11PLA2_BH11PLA2_17610 [soil metagenome]
MIRRALVASYCVPREDRDGGGRRLLDLIDYLLEAGWRVDVVALNGIENETRYVHALQRRGVAVHDDEPHIDADYSRKRSGVFEQLIANSTFDLALLAFWPVASHYMPLLRKLSPKTRVVIESVDLHFLRDCRRLLGAAVGEDATELLSDDYAANLIGEWNTYVAADAVLTVSVKERELLVTLLGQSVTAYAVVDSEEPTPSLMPMVDRRGLLLLGSFEHMPNVQALEYFLKEVLPRVDAGLLAGHPIYVVGNALDENLCKLAETLTNVRMVGWVPSVTPYFHRVRASIIPLLYGAGTKRKMIQALMHGTPSVSTSIGTEGLDLVDGEHVLLGDDASTFAKGIERLLQDEKLCRQLADNGLAHVRRSRGRTEVRANFHTMLETIRNRPAKPPMLPECSLKTYYQRICLGQNQQLALTIRKSIRRVIPRGRSIAVAYEGIADLLRLSDQSAMPFPQREDGQHRSEWFVDTDAFLHHVDFVISRGAVFLLIPERLFGQLLMNYPDLASRLEAYSPNLADDVSYRLYALQGDAPSRSIILTTDTPRSDTSAAVKLIAFFLPQFHPIHENDLWWGTGFTEWRNVGKALPLFAGHHQPQLPTDLGFYDLRLAETRQAQADLARRHGVHGFCYYHYWFQGKRLLERPFNEVLHSGQPDFPFCLCWANEPWSRRWDGSETDVLQPQSYSAEDDLEHIRWLHQPLSDSRAIRIQGKPVFMVYRADQLPEPARTTDLWRQEAERAGLPGLYLIAVETGWDAGWDATKVGFDAKVMFQPQFSLLGTVPRLELGPKNTRIFDYNTAWPVLANPEPVPYLRYDAVFPSWDNTARKGADAWVIYDSTPVAYEEWLRLAVQRAMNRPADQRVVFLNAWNEWAEGAHLEPDRKYGWAYLEATRRVVQHFSHRSGT